MALIIYRPDRDRLVMADFNVRSDSVNVEQIMEQIRARIREKRGVDYTEQQIRELAAVKLRSSSTRAASAPICSISSARRSRAYEPPELPNYAFEDDTLFESHRGAAPVDSQAAAAAPEAVLQPEPAHPGAAHPVAAQHDERRARSEARARAERSIELYYELIHNLVVETTRLGIEVKNLKMRVESLSSRLEFNERRARALESVVVYKPSADERERRRPPTAAAGPPRQSQPPRPSSRRRRSRRRTGAPGGARRREGPGQRSRRRRRRRGRRGGGRRRRRDHGRRRRRPPPAAMRPATPTQATPPAAAAPTPDRARRPTRRADEPSTPASRRTAAATHGSEPDDEQ